jgi:hypothetical protein
MMRPHAQRADRKDRVRDETGQSLNRKSGARSSPCHDGSVVPPAMEFEWFPSDRTNSQRHLQRSPMARLVIVSPFELRSCQGIESSGSTDSD